MWYPVSGVVLEFIDFWSLPPFLLCNLNYSWSLFDLFLSRDEILCFVVNHCQIVDLRFYSVNQYIMYRYFSNIWKTQINVCIRRYFIRVCYGCIDESNIQWHNLSFYKKFDWQPLKLKKWQFHAYSINIHWSKLINEHVTLLMLVQKVNICHTKFWFYK